MHAGTLKAFLLALCLVLSVAISDSAYAKSEGNDGGTSPVSKLEPFTVNLSGFEKYLQIIVTLQLAAPEVNDKVKQFMPMIRHNLIVILSSKDAKDLQTSDGKRDLVKEIKDKVNDVLEVREHRGVTDIFFENFIIQ